MTELNKRMSFIRLLIDETLYPVKFTNGPGETVTEGDKQSNSRKQPNTEVPAVKNDVSEKAEGESTELAGFSSQPAEKGVPVSEELSERGVEKGSVKNVMPGDMKLQIEILIEDPYGNQDIAPKFKLILDTLMQAASLKQQQYTIRKLEDASGEETGDDSGTYRIIFGRKEVVREALPEYEQKPGTIAGPYLEEFAVNRDLKRKFWNDLQSFLSEVKKENSSRE